MNGKTLLEVDNLRTYFFTRHGVVKAVDGVSFKVARGETLGLVGESGCGKTATCLSMLRLVPQPAGKIVGGRILVDGDDLLQKSEEQMQRIRGKKISIILQDPMTSLNPAFTIGEQVAEVVRVHQGLRKQPLWDRVISALRMVKIPSPEVRLRQYPHQMSGGMRQRVTGAIAVSCQPLILIADEPTTSLDVTVQRQYLALLSQVQQELGLGMIFVTHDLGIVAMVCDRVAVMYAGKIVESASVREIFKNPLHPYTRALLRCVPSLSTRVPMLSSIEGQPPSLLNPKPSCGFAARCPEAKESCHETTPEIVDVGGSHLVRCGKVA